MSRIGKLPIPIPEKAKIEFKDGMVTVKGEKGTLHRAIHPGVDLQIDNGVLKVIPVTKGREASALQGLVRSLVANMVTGVSSGFQRVLEINGIGYRAEVSGNVINLNLGYSHPIGFQLPEGISAEVEKNTVIKLSGIDREQLGQTAASIRKLRPPEPYKGKGIKYAEEHINRKAGKTGTK
ncbi:MAG: 50S ribosomal protein L6 [Desulfobacterales bacterium]|jgi:large subunit ribosomal protein L6|nr:50S ribosomal protein L6 [Desulfobacterales bacterium]